MKRYTIGFAIAVIVLFTINLLAQSPIDGFDPSANSLIYAIVVQPDGKILVGGDFDIIGGMTRIGIARLNADGSLDADFNPNAASVYSIALQPDGKIIIGGAFTNVGGTSMSYVARLNENGSLDTSFTPQVEDPYILSIAVQSDGKIVIGGCFTTIGGVTRDHIARLNSDGSLDLAFNPGANNWVLSIAIQADGKIIIGGEFTSVCGEVRNGIARLNPVGSLDGSFNPNCSSSIVHSICFQPDGKMIFGGAFMSVGGITRNRIARLNTDGTLDDSFNPNANNDVRSVSFQPDGKIVIGGEFTTVGGTTRNYIARLYTDGSLDGTFNPNANARLYTTAIQQDGKILAGGEFTFISGTTRNRIARIYPDGTLEKTINPNANSYLHTTVIQPDGKILIGGQFTAIGGTTRNYIARLNVDGSLDTTFNPNADSWIHSIAVQPDGKILIGGCFTAVCGTTRNRIARLNGDGSLDTSFNSSANGCVLSIAVQINNKILISGQFSSVDGAARNYIARLNSAGSLDNAFDPNVNNLIRSIAVQPDGKILIGGQFTFVGGTAREYFARINPNGTLDATFNAGVSGIVQAVVLQPDGKILIGGDIGYVGATPRNKIARLNSDGDLDDDFNPNIDESVFCVVLQPNGKILIGGDFHTVKGTTRNGIAKLDSSGNLETSFDPNANCGVRSIALQPDGKILAGGEFTLVSGIARNYFARLTNEEAAVQELQADDNTVARWMRSGAGPELDRVWFENSANMTTWTALGEGTRILGGWEVTGLALPCNTNIYIRARGYAKGSMNNAGTSIIESVRCIYFVCNTLIVNKSGAGNGTVTSDPAGIDCGSNCSESYLSGTVIALTAEADIGSSFAGWSGDCSACGINPECTVTMDASKSCTATFVLCAILDPEPVYTIGLTNAIGWNTIPDCIAYEAQASSDNFGTIFAESGQITETSYLFGGLTSGTDYQYRVRAVYPWGVSDWSSTVHSTQDAAAPSSIIVDPISGGLMYGSIYAVTGTAGDAICGVALVELSWDGGANWYPATGTTAWTYNWTLPADGNYTLFVRATDAVGNIETMHSIPVTVRNRPSPATNVLAVDVPYDGGGVIDVTWTLSGDDGGGMNYISGYSIYRASSAAGPFQKFEWVPAGVTYTQDTNAGVGINRYYKVRAETDWDVTPNFTDSEIFGPVAATDEAPLPVNNLLADLSVGCNIRLVWIESPSPDVLLYNIYYDNGTGTVNYSTPLGTVNAPATTWASSGLALNTRFIFAVRAKDMSGNEDILTANQVSITTECESGSVRGEIKQPQTGRKVKGDRVTILAELIQGTISQTKEMRFQYRPAGGGSWTDIAPSGSGEINPDTTTPYTLHWDTTVLTDADYDLRAVASNLASQPDPEPPYITVTVDNIKANLEENYSAGNHEALFEAYRGSGNSNIATMERDMTQVRLTIPKGSLPVTLGNAGINEEDPAIYSMKPAKGIMKSGNSLFVLTETLNVVGVYRTITLPGGQTNFSTYADMVIFYRDDNNDGIIDGTTIPALQLDVFREESEGNWSLQNSNRTVDTVNKFIRVTITQAGTFGLFSYPKPASVSGLMVAPSGSDARLYWPAVTLDDKGNTITVDHYNIFVGSTPDFTPDLLNHANLLSGGAGQVTGTETYDAGALTDDQPRYYLVTAVDATGKESYPR